MTIEDTPRHVAYVANAVAATAPAVSYWSGVSLGITITAGIVSILWMGFSTWKMLSPISFERFVKWLNK